MNLEHNNKAYRIDGVSIKELAEKFGTPCFVYSESSISKSFQEIKDVFGSNKKDIYYS